MFWLYFCGFHDGLVNGLFQVSTATVSANDNHGIMCCFHASHSHLLSSVPCIEKRRAQPSHP